MRVVSIILGILLVLAGMFMVVTPGATYASMSWVIGFLLILVGVNELAQYFAAGKTGKRSTWELVGGILSLVLGALVLFNPMLGIFVELSMTYAFDIWLIIGGILRIARAFEMRKTKEKNWGWVLTMAILSVVVGVYALFHIGTLMLAIGIMVGVSVMMSGFNLIAGSSMMGSGSNGGSAA